jgi:predicted lipoprotein with Yx(FWY)xxD motif
MRMRKPALLGLALAALAALVLAACGGGGSTTTSNANTSPEVEESSSENASSGGGAYGKPATSEEEAPAAESGSSGEATPVSVGTASGVGKVLVDSKGMTLYYFQKDQKGSGKSKCEEACAAAWPPLTTGGEPEAMSGVSSSMLGTIERSDGTTQVTYAGWPLYTFVEDKKPGEDNGTDSKAFGASWYPLHPNGQKAGH